MFGRSKTTNETLAEEVQQTHREGAKNRPTPKRREQEAARKRPLVVTDHKAARAADRTKRREQMAQQRAAMLSGDETHLPARDKGPVRRYIRDYIDARWGVGEFMLPVMLIVLALSFIRQPWAMLTVFILVYSLIALSILDTFLMWLRLKKKLVAKFGADKVSRGDGFCVAMRAFQMRRTRMPRPVIDRGNYPS